VHVHAIGDRAVRAALDSFDRIAPSLPRSLSLPRGGAASRPRHQIAHLEVIHPDDVPRFRRLGVIANFQPLWAFADSYVVDLTWPLLGPERSRRLYPMASVARAGGPIAFGSDWSVSSLDPLEGIQVAVTRRDPDGLDHPGEPRGRPMQPEEILDLPTALAAYTIGAAWANRLEADTGSIEVGKAADLVVLSDDLFALPPARIATARVLMTLIDGAVVYSRDSTTAAPPP
jgi:predicted amidohydrolase YtcJ